MCREYFVREGKSRMDRKVPERKPEWLKVRANTGRENEEVMALLRSLSLHTVCESADCPNCGECFRRRTATFMILGGVCTRNCRFCSVTKGCPETLDQNEPEHVAEAAHRLGLRHVVVTSVTRDDLPDGGAAHFARVIRSIRRRFGDAPPVIEVLIPDFKGDAGALGAVLDAAPDILNHNVETVPRLYPEVRPMAVYERSLEVLRLAKAISPDIVTKSGLMVGLGERLDEVVDVMRDLRGVGCDLLTIGQYLAPSKLHHPVVEYVEPSVFDAYREKALEMGFKYAACGPLVRSSYMAEDTYMNMKGRAAEEADGEGQP